MRLPQVQSTGLDRAIAWVSPAWGARRLQNRFAMALVGGYTGGLNRRSMQEWATREESADAAILPNLDKLRQRCRDLERNNAIAAGIIGTSVQKVIGTGLSLQAAPDARLLGWSETQVAEWAGRVQDEFRLFAENKACDLTLQQDFYQLQGLAWQAQLQSGDVFVNFPFLETPFSLYGLRLQLIEADRVVNPWGKPDGFRLPDGSHVSGGIETDPLGVPVAAHVLQEHPGALLFSRLSRRTERVPFRNPNGRVNLLHQFHRKRIGQTRGVPVLAPVVEAIRMLGEYSQAELERTVVSALFTAFVKSGSGLGLANPAGTPAELDETQIKLGKGSVVDLGQYDDIKFAQPTSPNTAFDGFITAFSRFIGMALGIPSEVLMKQFRASYSASRAALLEAWHFFRIQREFFASNFCQVVYELWLEEAILRGRVDASGFFDAPELRMAYAGAHWLGDAPGSLDPMKETEAAALAVEKELSTLEDEVMARSGKSWRTDIHPARAAEIALQRKDGTAVAAAEPAKPQGPDKDDEDEEAA